MKIRPLLKMLVSCLLGACMWFAMAASRQDYEHAEPIEIINTIVETDDSKVIDTELNRVDNSFGPFDTNLKIANTFDSVRFNMSSYLERIVFLGLSGAVILIIYNGLRLALSPVSEWEAANVRKRIVYIFVGAILLTGFYLVLKVVLNVILDIAI